MSRLLRVELGALRGLPAGVALRDAQEQIGECLFCCRARSSDPIDRLDDRLAGRLTDTLVGTMRQDAESSLQKRQTTTKKSFVYFYVSSGFCKAILIDNCLSAAHQIGGWRLVSISCSIGCLLAESDCTIDGRPCRVCEECSVSVRGVRGILSFFEGSH